jgi:hypothetical protein
MTNIPRIQIANDSLEPHYADILSAISIVSEGRRQIAARAANALIKGSTIESINWTKEALYFLLSNGKTLSFFLSNGHVDWALEEGHDRRMTPRDEGSPTILCFPTGIESMWDPAQVLQPGINKMIEGIFATATWVFLYVDQCRVLLLAGLFVEGQQYRLYWSDAD